MSETQAPGGSPPTDQGRGSAIYWQNRVALAVAQFSARTNEIQWRGLQRDAIILFAFTACAAALSIQNARLVVFGPIPLLYLGSMCSTTIDAWGRTPCTSATY